MSHKRTRSQEAEQQRWLEETRRRREEATLRAEAEKRKIPGYVRVPRDEE